jgi:hypothetical protein
MTGRCLERPPSTARGARTDSNPRPSVWQAEREILSLPRNSCKTAISGLDRVGDAYQDSPRNHRGFRTETGLGSRRFCRRLRGRATGVSSPLGAAGSRRATRLAWLGFQVWCLSPWLPTEITFGAGSTDTSSGSNLLSARGAGAARRVRPRAVLSAGAQSSSARAMRAASRVATTRFSGEVRSAPRGQFPVFRSPPLALCEAPES